MKEIAITKPKGILIMRTCTEADFVLTDATEPLDTRQIALLHPVLGSSNLSGNIGF